MIDVGNDGYKCDYNIETNSTWQQQQCCSVNIFKPNEINSICFRNNQSAFVLHIRVLLSLLSRKLNIICTSSPSLRHLESVLFRCCCAKHWHCIVILMKWNYFEIHFKVLLMKQVVAKCRFQVIRLSTVDVRITSRKWCVLDRERKPAGEWSFPHKH